MTPLVEKVPEPLEVRPHAPLSEPIGDGFGSTTFASEGTLQLQIASGVETPRESDASQQRTEATPLKLELSPGDVPGRGGRLWRSFAALGQIRSSREAGDWIEAASTLKADAVRLRNSPKARHSAVLLAVADALTFTDPADPALDAASYEPLERSISLLSEPFIAERVEEDFLVDLVRGGWNLAPEIDIASAPT